MIGLFFLAQADADRRREARDRSGRPNKRRAIKYLKGNEMSMPFANLNVGKIIEVLIVLIICGAIWYLFTMFAGMVGLPSWVVTVVVVVVVVFIAIYVLRFLGSLLGGGGNP